MVAALSIDHNHNGGIMLALVKLALGVSGNAYDTLLNMLIDAACKDLGIAGVVDGENPVAKTTTDELLKNAIITYCKAHFGQPENPELLMKSYTSQKAQLQIATGYTDWGEE